MKLVWELISQIASKVIAFYIDGLVQHCSNSIANALELLQFCTKPSMWSSRRLEHKVHLQK